MAKRELNIAALKLVRDRIASIAEERFSMSSYFGKRGEDGYVSDSWDRSATNARMLEGSCGSCACIAGHALAVLEPDEEVPTDVLGKAAEALGLEVWLAGRLFEPNNNDEWFINECRRLSGVTQSEAVAVLDHLIATGKVDWSAAAQ